MNRPQKKSDTSEDIKFLNEICAKERQQKEPSRWDYVLSVLKDRGYEPVEDREAKCIRFTFKGNTVSVWPFTGWFSGKGVHDGRGIKKLLKQI